MVVVGSMESGGLGMNMGSRGRSCRQSLEDSLVDAFGRFSTEVELAIVIGKACRDVTPEAHLHSIWIPSRSPWALDDRPRWTAE